MNSRFGEKAAVWGVTTEPSLRVTLKSDPFRLGGNTGWLNTNGRVSARSSGSP